MRRTRRRWFVIAAAAGLFVLAAVVATLLLLGGGSGRPAGPLVGPSIREGSGFPRDADEPLTYAAIRVFNPGPAPVTLERVSLVDPDEGIRLVGALAAPQPSGAFAVAYPSFPPSRDYLPPRVVEFPDLRPLRGYVVAPQPGATEESATLTQLYLGLESTEPRARLTLQSFRIHYRVGAVRYELVVPHAVAICTPREEWAGLRPCGHLNGPFLPGEDR